MKISIISPETLQSERTKLINEAVEIVKQQERSCARYAMKLALLRNRIRKIESKLGA